ncbi:MAG TPA: type IX secretion system membrane protein PorP/SprF [Bacteroidales bacterium]|nr:type IX secretion system membrane protein PorP/SprF [Bacteroidales bacterium]HPS16304.1 type IX secretion system membrane protein PorP/SprF [Bacteroidales bacterium]
MKTITKILALMLFTATGYAQQDAQYNQYIFNMLVINPAYAGTKEVFNANAIYSSQWTGFAGSPTTQTLGIDGPITNKIGVGLHLINDKIGAENQNGIFGSYSFKVKISKTLKLSMGIAIGATNFNIDGSELVTITPDDPQVPKSMTNKFRFDSKTGVFLYNERFFAGISCSNLTADVFKSKDLLVASQVRHYYLTSGYVFDIAPNFKFKPSFLMKEDFKAPSNIDINAFLLYNNKFWLGASIRTGAKIFTTGDLESSLRLRDAFLVMAEYNINDLFRVGYAYTYSISTLSDYPGHEFSLGYYFPNKTTSSVINPRYF